MSDSTNQEREQIRQAKQRELEQKLAGNGDSVGGDTADSTPSEPIHIEDDGHFQNVVESHPVVLVDCYADWCGPCKMIEPTVKALAAETDAAVAKVDVDQHPGLAQQLGVRGVPTLAFYADGQPVKRLVGVQDRGTLEQLIEQYN